MTIEMSDSPFPHQQTITLVIGNWLSLFLMTVLILVLSLMLFWSWTNKVENQLGRFESTIKAVNTTLESLKDEVRVIREAVLKPTAVPPTAKKNIAGGVQHGQVTPSAPGG